MATRQCFAEKFNLFRNLLYGIMLPLGVGNSHRSASPRPTTSEEDRKLSVVFSSILCLWFEIQGMRTYNFFDWVSNTASSLKSILSKALWMSQILKRPSSDMWIILYQPTWPLPSPMTLTLKLSLCFQIKISTTRVNYPYSDDFISCLISPCEIW